MVLKLAIIMIVKFAIIMVVRLAINEDRETFLVWFKHVYQLWTAKLFIPKHFNFLYQVAWLGKA